MIHLSEHQKYSEWISKSTSQPEFNSSGPSFIYYISFLPEPNNVSPISLISTGIDFKVKTIEIEGKKVKLQVW